MMKVVSKLKQRQFQIKMQIQKIHWLTKHLKQQSLLSIANASLPPQQLLAQLQQTQQSYNQLLLDSLSLAELVDDLHFHNSEQYEVLMGELEKERVHRREDVRELQENAQITGCKLGELKLLISDREMENMSLRCEIQEREGRISQLEQESRQYLLKMESSYNSRLVEQLSQQVKDHQVFVSRLKNEFQSQIVELREQNQRFLDENTVLSGRLDQIMKYVKEMEAEVAGKDMLKSCQSANQKEQLPPRLLCGHNSPKSNDNRSQALSIGTLSQKSEQALKLEEMSHQTSSPQRMILHQILNTEDCKGFNFGNSTHSLHQSYLLNDENSMNTMNKMESAKSQKQKKGAQMNIIQQFMAQEPINCKKDHMEINPYYIFFTLTAQCAKIHSGDLEKASSIDLKPQWSTFLDEKVPLHQWYGHLKAYISSHV